MAVAMAAVVAVRSWWFEVCSWYFVVCHNLHENYKLTPAHDPKQFLREISEEPFEAWRKLKGGSLRGVLEET